ncbi:MAG: hypothetical protein M0Z28_31745 [Rhodospirillales bacterium]|nr:hypothetical protein [Rhodospirillales bacterium]
MIVIGVDTGALGALAFLTESGELLSVADMPVDLVEVAGKERKRISAPRLADLLRPFADGAHLFCELPTGRPLFGRNKQTGQVESRTPGAAGMLALGESVGMVRMAAAAFNIAFTGMQPGIWKKALRCPAGKDDARRMAMETFPAHRTLFARVRDDGRAEAALISVYGLRTLSRKM